MRPLALAVDLCRQRSQNNEFMGKNAALGEVRAVRAEQTGLLNQDGNSCE